MDGSDDDEDNEDARTGGGDPAGEAVPEAARSFGDMGLASAIAVPLLHLASPADRHSGGDSCPPFHRRAEVERRAPPPVATRTNLGLARLSS
jgi:hypothetical protein